MSVIVPPRVAPKARGMRIFLAGTPVRRDQARRIGISRATIGVLFRKACQVEEGGAGRERVR